MYLNLHTFDLENSVWCRSFWGYCGHYTLRLSILITAFLAVIQTGFCQSSMPPPINADVRLNAPVAGTVPAMGTIADVATPTRTPIPTMSASQTAIPSGTLSQASALTVSTLPGGLLPPQNSNLLMVVGPLTVSNYPSYTFQSFLFTGYAPIPLQPIDLFRVSAPYVPIPYVTDPSVTITNVVTFSNETLAPESSPTSTPTPTATSTATPTATNTPTPTSTPSCEDRLPQKEDLGKLAQLILRDSLREFEGFTENIDIHIGPYRYRLRDGQFEIQSRWDQPPFQAWTKLTDESLRQVGGNDQKLAAKLLALSKMTPKEIVKELCQYRDPCPAQKKKPDLTAIRAHIGALLIAARLRKGPSGYFFQFDAKNNRFTVQGKPGKEGGEAGAVIEITDKTLFRLEQDGGKSLNTVLFGEDMELAKALAALAPNNGDNPNGKSDEELERLDLLLTTGYALIGQFLNENPNSPLQFQYEQGGRWWEVGFVLRPGLPFLWFPVTLDTAGDVIGMKNISGAPLNLIMNLLSLEGISNERLRRFICLLGRYDPDCSKVSPTPQDFQIIAETLAAELLIRFNGKDPQGGIVGDIEYRINEKGEIEVARRPAAQNVWKPLSEIKSLGVCVSPADLELKSRLDEFKQYSPERLAQLRCSLKSGACSNAVLPEGGVIGAIKQAGELLVLMHQRSLAGEIADEIVFGYRAGAFPVGEYQYQFIDGVWHVRHLKVKGPNGKPSPGVFVPITDELINRLPEQEKKLSNALLALGKMKPDDLAKALCFLKQRWQRVKVLRYRLFKLFGTLTGQISGVYQICLTEAMSICDSQIECLDKKAPFFAGLVMYGSDAKKARDGATCMATVVGELAETLQKKLSAILLMDETWEWKIAQLSQLTKEMRKLYAEAKKPNPGLEAWLEKADQLVKDAKDVKDGFDALVSVVPGASKLVDALDAVTRATQGDPEAWKQIQKFAEDLEKDPSKVALKQFLGELLGKLIKNAALRNFVIEMLTDDEFRSELLKIIKSGECKDFDEKFKRLVIKFILKKIRAPKWVQDDPELAEAFIRGILDNADELFKGIGDLDQEKVTAKLLEMLLKIIKEWIAGKIGALIGGNPNIAGILGGPNDIKAVILEVLDGFNLQQFDQIDWNALIKKILVKLIAGRLGIAESDVQDLLDGKSVEGLEIGGADLDKLLQELKKLTENPNLQTALVAVPIITATLVPIINAILKRLKFTTGKGNKVQVTNPPAPKPPGPVNKTVGPCDTGHPIKKREQTISCGKPFTIVFHETPESLKAEFVKSETGGNAPADDCDMAKRIAANLVAFVEVTAGKIHVVEPPKNETVEQKAQRLIALAQLIDDLLRAQGVTNDLDRARAIACFLCQNGLRLALGATGEWEVSAAPSGYDCTSSEIIKQLKSWLEYNKLFRIMKFVKTQGGDFPTDLTGKCKVEGATPLKSQQGDAPGIRTFLTNAVNLTDVSAIPAIGGVRLNTNNKMCSSSVELKACTKVCVRAKDSKGNVRVFLANSPISFVYSGRLVSNAPPPIQWSWSTSLGPISVSKDVTEPFDVLVDVAEKDCNDQLKDKATHKVQPGWGGLNAKAPYNLASAPNAPALCPGQNLNLAKATTGAAVSYVDPKSCNAAWTAPGDCMCASLLRTERDPKKGPFQCNCLDEVVTDHLKKHVPIDVSKGSKTAPVKIPRLNGGTHVPERFAEWLEELLNDKDYQTVNVDVPPLTAVRDALLDWFGIPAGDRAGITGATLFSKATKNVQPSANGVMCVTLPQWIFASAQPYAASAGATGRPPGHPDHGYPRGGKCIFPDSSKWDWQEALKKCLGEFKKECAKITIPASNLSTESGGAYKLQYEHSSGSNGTLYCTYSGVRIGIGISIGADGNFQVGTLFPAWNQ